MKNKIIILLVVCVIIAIICISMLLLNNRLGNNGYNDILNVIEQTPIASTRKIGKYIDLVSGNYYMKSSTISIQDSSKKTMITENATLDSKTMIYEDQYKTSIILTDKESYYIMNDTKVAYKQDLEENEANSQTDKNTQRLLLIQFYESNFIETGTEEVNGTKYYYEQYKSEDSGSAKYYFDSQDNLKYIQTVGNSEGDTLTEILVLTSNVDENLFKIPSDYTVKSIEELYTDMTSIMSE